MSEVVAVVVPFTAMVAPGNAPLRSVTVPRTVTFCAANVPQRDASRAHKNSLKKFAFISFYFRLKISCKKKRVNLLVIGLHAF
jgi:hypothetical protein